MAKLDEKFNKKSTHHFDDDNESYEMGKKNREKKRRMSRQRHDVDLPIGDDFWSE